MKRIAQISALAFLAVALAAAAASAAELAVLRNGFSVRADHRESRGAITRLYTDAAGQSFVDVPSDAIDHFEALPDPPKPPLPAAAPVRTVTLDEIVTSVSRRYGIDPDLVLSLIHAESDFDQHAVSPKGALGLMQLMPRTANELGVANPMDPAANIDGGTRYLVDLLTLYHQDLYKALAAYNAGPARVQEYHGIPPYPETIAYITRIVQDLNARKLGTRKGSPSRAKEQKARRQGVAVSEATTSPYSQRARVGEPSIEGDSNGAGLHP